MASDTVEWVKVALGILEFAIMISFSIWQVRLVGRFMREALSGLNPVLARDPPRGKIAVRRLFCSHRHVSRVKNAWGLNYTACTSCGVDVNRGKPREEWR